MSAADKRVHPQRFGIDLTDTTIIIIIIITHLLHENKSQVLIIHKWQICKWNKPEAISLYKGLCQEQGKYIYIIYYVSMSACAACVAVMSNYKHTLK